LLGFIPATDFDRGLERFAVWLKERLCAEAAA
jgi:hypothetical protein